jgi:autotransporter-associated beta strand protein
MSREQKRRRAAAAVAATVVGVMGSGTSNADASLTIELRALSLSGSGTASINDSKSVTYSSGNVTVNIGVYARLTGANFTQTTGNYDAGGTNNDTRNDDPLQIVTGSFRSMGSLLGNMGPLPNQQPDYDTRRAPFTAIASSNGVALDWDNDGDLDIGNGGTDLSGMWSVRAQGQVFATRFNGTSDGWSMDVGPSPFAIDSDDKIIDATTSELRVGTLRFVTIGLGGDGNPTWAQVNFVPRPVNEPGSALWWEDGAATGKYPGFPGSTYLLGTPVVINVVPPTLYWDGNGSGTGAGTAPNGTWGASTFWTANAAGLTTPGPYTGDGRTTAVFSAGSTATTPFSVAVSGTQTAAALLFEEGNVTLTGGGITLAQGSINVAAGATASISSSITATSGLTKNGSGLLALSGDNALIASFALAGGTATLGHIHAAGVGAITVPAAAMVELQGATAIDLPNNFVVGAGAKLDLEGPGSGVLTFSGQISGAGQLSRGQPIGTGGAGSVVLTGDNSAWSGGMLLSRGLLVLGHRNALGTGTLSIQSSGGVGATPEIQASTPLTGANALQVPVLMGGTFVIGGASDIEFAGPAAVDGSPAATIIVNNTGASIFSAGISGATLVSKLGAGTLSVGNARTNLKIGEGTVKVLANSTATGVSNVPFLTVTGGGKFDLTNNKLVTNNPVGSAVGTNYTDISGLIQAGRNGGGWNGSSIVTSQTDAITSNRTSIGVATAQQAKSLASASATAVWAGQTVTGSQALVMYTYGGDANLDGKINVDDYGRIDFNVNLVTSGWYNGDFNYDGKINVDDYGIIDFNVGIQGAPFFTGAGIGNGGNTFAAVPEPRAAALFAGAGGLLALLRRPQRGHPSPI